MRILPILVLISFFANAQVTGTWKASNNGEQINLVLNADGTGQLDGEPIKYAVKSGVITVTSLSDNEVLNYNYTLNGNTLKVSGGDLEEPITFTKATVSNGKKSVPQELVGKWCWANVTNSGNASTSSDACITLNADGTYTYYSERSMSVSDGSTNSESSDRGAWWVEGNRIYYDSQTRGQGSYLLEKRNHPKNVNDPMIVLDGQAYVTAFQKAPWR